MKLQKMSLANIQGKLSRAEMKNVMAGSGSACDIFCPTSGGGWGGYCIPYTTCGNGICIPCGGVGCCSHG